jgi:hypothetical protein
MARKGRSMPKRAKGKSWLSLSVFLISLFSVSLFLGSYEKKVKVVADYCHVFLQPDDSSSVVDTIERGAILSLISSGKTKKVWYHVCYRSEKTGITKSGYVLDSAVEPLFDILKTLTIREEVQEYKVHYVPRKFDEMEWGVSKKQVLESEGKPVEQRRARGLDIMKYEQKVINLDCSIEYLFSANRLSKTRFLFTNTYLDKNAYLGDYQTIKEALIQKFGKPLEENMSWQDPTYKEDFSNWGEAVSLGHLVMSSRWQTPQTNIQASLSGNDEDIALVVEYTALRLNELARRGQEEE